MVLYEELVGLPQQRGVNRHCQTHEIFALQLLTEAARAQLALLAAAEV